MAQLHLIKQSQGILIPATPETSDFLQSKCKLGSVLEADYKLVRNPAFHRRYFALLNLGFEYWEPTGGAISSNERRLITGYAKYLAAYGGNECKRAARTVLTGMCYSVGSATRQGSSSLTRFIGQSAMTSRT
ncbi:TPA: DUF1367 family protein [Klebsiella pneumoniae]